MDYFRQKLLTYSTERQISTLLHIHVQADKARVLIPPSKAKNYVDQVLNQYTVKMYDYPDLSMTDTKLGFNIFQMKNQINQTKQPKEYRDMRQNLSIFQIQEKKHKPLKKKIIKKASIQVPPQIPSQTQELMNFKICPCCNIKVFSKHHCEHNLCEKPCARVKRLKQFPINSQHSQTKKMGNFDDEDFTPSKEESENQESKYGDSDLESDYQEEIDFISQEFSQSFISNLSKNKRVQKKRTRTRVKRQQRNKKNHRTRGKGRNSRRRSQNRRNGSAQYVSSSFRYHDRSQRHHQVQNKIQIQQKLEEYKKIDEQQPQLIYEQRPQQTFQIKKETENRTNNMEVVAATPVMSAIRKKRSRQKVVKINPSQSYVQSQQFCPGQELKKIQPFNKRRSSLNKRGSEEQQKEKELGSQSKKKTTLSILTFCTIEQLKQNSLFDFKIYQPQHRFGRKPSNMNNNLQREKEKQRQREIQRQRQREGQKQVQKQRLSQVKILPIPQQLAMQEDTRKEQILSKEEEKYNKKEPEEEKEKEKERMEEQMEKQLEQMQMQDIQCHKQSQPMDIQQQEQMIDQNVNQGNQQQIPNEKQNQEIEQLNENIQDPVYQQQQPPIDAILDPLFDQNVSEHSPNQNEVGQGSQ